MQRMMVIKYNKTDGMRYLQDARRKTCFEYRKFQTRSQMTSKQFARAPTSDLGWQGQEDRDHTVQFCKTSFLAPHIRDTLVMDTEMEPPNCIRWVTKRSLDAAAAQVWIEAAAAAVEVGANFRETDDDQRDFGGKSILDYEDADKREARRIGDGCEHPRSHSWMHFRWQICGFGPDGDR